MQQKREIFYIGVIISLIIFMFVSQSTLSHDLQQIENNIQNIRMEVSNEVGRIEYQVDQIREDARWWSPGEVTIEPVGEDKQKLTSRWHLREYEEGEPVFLHYRLTGEEDEFQKIEMEETSSGIFQASLEMEVEYKPEIWVDYSGSQASNNGYVEEARRIEGGHESRYLDHYLSTVVGGTQRSTAKQQEYLERLRLQAFNPIHIDLHYNDSKNPEYYLYIHMDGHNSDVKNQLEDVEVFLLQGSRVSQELDLVINKQDYMMDIQESISPDEVDFDEILLRFIYDTGEVFEERLTPHGEDS